MCVYMCVCVYTYINICRHVCVYICIFFGPRWIWGAPSVFQLVSSQISWHAIISKISFKPFALCKTCKSLQQSWQILLTPFFIWVREWPQVIGINQVGRLPTTVASGAWPTGWRESCSPLPPVSSVQSPRCFWLFVSPWTAARRTSMSITNSWNLLKLMFIELVMPSNRLILCHPLLLLAFSLSHHQGLFQWVSSSKLQSVGVLASASPLSPHLAWSLGIEKGWVECENIRVDWPLLFNLREKRNQAVFLLAKPGFNFLFTHIAVIYCKAKRNSSHSLEPPVVGATDWYPLRPS